jgi:hypothetical protein
MSTIPIHCVHSTVVPINSLVENPRNTNRHPIDQIELLARIIEKNGWRSPIIVSNRSGFIVKGHGRYEAAKLLALTEVPVEYQDYASEAEEYADMLADNRIAELAEMDLAGLNTLLEQATAAGATLDSMGFTDAAFEDLRKKVNEANPGTVAAAASSQQENAEPGVTVEPLVIGKYKLEVPAPRANEWLQEIYLKFNNDENLIFADVKRRLGL